MFRGVQFYDGNGHRQGVQAVLDTSARGNVYVVDTYAMPGIQSGADLLRAVAKSMSVAEWYGYDVETIASQALSIPANIYLLVLVITPHHRHLLTEGVLQGLSRVHERSLTMGTQFWTAVFENPVALTGPSL